MSLNEDAASVLDTFVHDVANLPAEIAHLLEEIQAKDRQIQECRNAIIMRDNALQRHAKQNGGHVKHPKEEQFLKVVSQNFDNAMALQEDKVALSEKAKMLLDRQVKRLDLKIRDLTNEGQMLEDPSLPSLLHASPANLVEPTSTTSTGVNTPMHPIAVGPGSTSIANAAMARMANNAQQTVQTGAPQAPMAGMQPHPLLQRGNSVPRQREMSAGAAEPKHRRLNNTLGTLPVPTSNLARSASMGPGTPKASTPGSRAGSAGPRTKRPSKKTGTFQQNMRKKIGKSGLSQKSQRRLMSENRASPSTGGEDGSENSGSEEGDTTLAHGHDGADDEEVEEPGYDEDGDDNRPYCLCHSVSHGNMVGCDNQKCELEWFHWECVGLKEEPKGKWLCPNCRKLPSNQIKYMSK